MKHPIIIFILFSFGFASCLGPKLRQANETITKLEHEKQDTVNYYYKQIATYKSELARSKAKSDSLNKVIAGMPADLLQAIDSLGKNGTSLANQLQALKGEQAVLTESLKSYESVMHDLYGVKDNRAQRVPFKGQVFDCYIVNTASSDIQFYWKDEADKKPFLSLGKLKKALNGKQKELVFASNAGMYKKDNSPQGLFIQHGKVLVKIDRRKEEFGNFYMQPNGIFLIDTGGMAKIIDTDNYADTMLKSIEFATQSGPLMVIDGKINEKFTQGSDNKNIRNGVGIIDKNHVVFAISNVPVNFYDFASLFKTHFNCMDALYLDGAISETYLPELARFQTGGNFGPIIGITK